MDQHSTKPEKPVEPVQEKQEPVADSDGIPSSGVGAPDAKRMHFSKY
jgi:hypothetical protein